MAHIPSIVRAGPIAKAAKPLLSTSPEEARRRVLTLYRMWIREVPTVIELHGLDIPLSTIRKTVYKEFEKNKNLSDIRVIDMLVVKGKQENHVMKWFPEDKPKQKDFLTKFYEGYD